MTCYNILIYYFKTILKTLGLLPADFFDGVNSMPNCCFLCHITLVYQFQWSFGITLFHNIPAFLVNDLLLFIFVFAISSCITKITINC